MWVNVPFGAWLLLGGLGRVDILPHVPKRSFGHLVCDVNGCRVTPSEAHGKGQINIRLSKKKEGKVKRMFLFEETCKEKQNC